MLGLLLTLNPIILETLKKYMSENPDIPNSVERIVNKLLDTECLIADNPVGKEGIYKLYEQILEQHANDDHRDLLEWSENYAK